MGDTRIEDWSMYLDGNFKIQELWNATIEEENADEERIYYNIKNHDYNQNIEPNQSVEYGFVASCEEEAEIFAVSLYSMTSDFDIEDEDDELVDEGESNFPLDMDEFETDEEYEEYLAENGLEDISVETSSTEMKMKMRKAQKTVTGTARDIGLKLTDKAVQSYLPLSNGDYYLMSGAKVGGERNHAQVTTRSTQEDGTYNFSTKVTFKEFGHGQTFEQFAWKGSQKEYYLLAGGGKRNSRFGTKLVLMPSELFADFANGRNKNFALSYWKEHGFCVMDDMKYLFPEMPKGAELHRVDAAISANGRYIAIWQLCKKMVNGKEKRWTKLAIYDMYKIMKLYNKREKSVNKKIQEGELDENQKNRWMKLSCKKYQDDLRKARIYTLNSKNLTQANNVLLPNGSFQSVDVECLYEAGVEKWMLLITSGNETKTKTYSDATVTRIEVVRKVTNKMVGNEEKKIVKMSHKTFRSHLLLEGYPKAKLEIEGGHIMNRNRYNFVVLQKVKGGRKQYFAKLNPMEITGTLE